jgi:hypothetical protein
MNATLFSHIMLVIAAFLLLIGSAGQAWESMIAYQNELNLVRHLIDEKMDDMASEPYRYEIGYSFDDPGIFVYNIILTMLAIPVYLKYLFTYFMFEALPSQALLKPLNNYVQEKRKAREANPEHRMKFQALPDKERMQALRRTASNWAFVMLGSLAALVASMTDLIVGLTSRL